LIALWVDVPSTKEPTSIRWQKTRRGYSEGLTWRFDHPWNTEAPEPFWVSAVSAWGHLDLEVPLIL